MGGGLNSLSFFILVSPIQYVVFLFYNLFDILKSVQVLP